MPSASSLHIADLSESMVC